MPTSVDTVKEGNLPMLEAQLVPDAVRISGTSETIEYHAEIVSRLPEAGTFAWSASVADDRGNIVAKVGTGEGAINAKDTKSTSALVPNLPDGFYALRVLSAVHSPHWEDVAEGVQYLRVKNRTMREMTATDWYQASSACLAVKVSDEGVK